MLICWLTLYAAVAAEEDDVGQRTSLLQLRQTTNVTASSTTLGTQVDAGEGAAEGLLSALRDGGDVSAAQDKAPAKSDVGTQSGQGAAATLTAARRSHKQSKGHSHQKQRLYAHQTHQYQGRDLGSLFENKVTSTTCSAGAASAAAYLVGEVNVIRDNLDYRVGDVLKKGGFFWKKSREHLLTAPYDGTALQTLLKDCAARGDLECDLSLQDLGDALESIGRENGFATPDEGTVVAYVRAGDVIGPCEDHDEIVYNYNGDEVGAGLQDPRVKAAIAGAMAKGYSRLHFVVVESYADRADAGEHGYWMYTDAKHEENQKQLRAAFEDIIEDLCAGGQEISFGVASFVNVDETLYYMMHATTLVGERTRIANHGFPYIAVQLTQTQNASAAIITPRTGPAGYPECSGVLGNAAT